MLLSNCSTTTERLQHSPQIIVAQPPQMLLQSCEDPHQPVETIGDMTNQLLATRGKLAQCNRQIAALRQWSEESEIAFHDDQPEPEM